jgi:nucleoside-diphosphate-sugar epimerase
VRALAEAGHRVTACLRSSPSQYQGVRSERVRRLEPHAELASGMAFGDAAFLDLVSRGPWDVLCHHAAEVTDYRSANFDYLRAMAANTRQASEVVRILKSQGSSTLVLTGSYFEPDEGGGGRAFSPYGLSKGLTWQVFRFWCEQQGLPLSKFVIPNPFGPLEEPRFCQSLVSAWARGERARVATPGYVRDNIHVSLLARAYAAWVGAAGTHLSPSGYVETQGAFARRLATEIGRRLPLRCELELAEQADWSEPAERAGRDKPDAARLGWDETQAWDELAEYYGARLCR